jgi:putative serine protease PepD
LGVRYVTLTPAIAKQLDLDQTTGAYLLGDDSTRAIVAGSPADKAGLRARDIITKVNDGEVTEKSPLGSLMNRYNVGDTITIAYLRSGEVHTVEIELEAAPDSP